MPLSWANSTLSVLCLMSILSCPASAQKKGAASTPTAEQTWSGQGLVDLAAACPTIRIELRYATARNMTGKPIYPANARCLILPSVAQRLNHAQDELHAKGFSLKIWDAYRPAWAQKILWQAKPNAEFLQPPDQTPSMHTRGMAVDATLVDLQGHAIEMPSDFDEFSATATMYYSGGDSRIARNLRILQTAMGHAGFFGMRNEWWHFVAQDYALSKPLEASLKPGKMKKRE